LHPKVATEAARNGVAAKGPGGQGADVILANGRSREVSVHSADFTDKSISNHLLEEIGQENVDEIYLQINSPGATRRELLEIIPNVRSGYQELRGIEIHFFGPDGQLWWHGIFHGP
jgi:hypothetical protein